MCGSLVIFRAPVEPPHRSAAAQRPKAASSRVISSQAQQLPGFRSKAIKAARAKPITDNLTRISSWVVESNNPQLKNMNVQNGEWTSSPKISGVKIFPNKDILSCHHLPVDLIRMEIGDSWLVGGVFLFQRKHVEFFFVGVIFWLENLGCMMMVDAYDIPLFGPVVQV